MRSGLDVELRVQPVGEVGGVAVERIATTAVDADLDAFQQVATTEHPVRREVLGIVERARGRVVVVLPDRRAGRHDRPDGQPLLGPFAREQQRAVTTHRPADEPRSSYVESAFAEQRQELVENPSSGVGAVGPGVPVAAPVDAGEGEPTAGRCQELVESQAVDELVDAVPGSVEGDHDRQAGSAVRRVEHRPLGAVQRAAVDRTTLDVRNHARFSVQSEELVGADSAWEDVVLDERAGSRHATCCRGPAGQHSASGQPHGRRVGIRTAGALHDGADAPLRFLAWRTSKT